MLVALISKFTYWLCIADIIYLWENDRLPLYPKSPINHSDYDKLFAAHLLSIQLFSQLEIDLVIIETK